MYHKGKRERILVEFFLGSRQAGEIKRLRLGSVNCFTSQLRPILLLVRGVRSHTNWGRAEEASSALKGNSSFLRPHVMALICPPAPTFPFFLQILSWGATLFLLLPGVGNKTLGQ